MNIFPRRATPAERELSAAEKLADRAQRATELRNYQTNPDVQALMGERIRRALMVSQWLGITFCLIFTAVNVQKFVAGDVEQWTPGWVTAWIYDPSISVILVGLLLVEQWVTSHGRELGWRAKAAKWAAFIFTLLMNCWTGLFPHGLLWWQPENQLPNVAEVVKHAVPPILAFLVCEAAPGIHRLLTQIIHEAYAAHSAKTAPQGAAGSVAGGRVNAAVEPSAKPSTEDRAELPDDALAKYVEGFLADTFANESTDTLVRTSGRDSVEDDQPSSDAVSERPAETPRRTPQKRSRKSAAKAPRKGSAKGRVDSETVRNHFRQQLSAGASVEDLKAASAVEATGCSSSAAYDALKAVRAELSEGDASGTEESR